MPHSDHVLNIFEPRYRAMYGDILFNGSRRFVVPVSNPETGALASVAPVFYLEDLKEVSEQTKDQVKYVCSHKAGAYTRPLCSST
jgi:Lon protease-like protein